MLGFINHALPLTRATRGPAISPRTVKVRGPTMKTREMSKSVPFLLKPKNLEGLPASYDFDPLLISDYINVRFLQAAEIKHGRICMLAAVGLIVPEFFTFPNPYFPKMLAVDAHNYFINTGGMSQILLFIAAFEGISCYALKQTIDGKHEPGYFGFDPLGLGKDPVKFKKYQANEIMNGRLAMIAVGGMIHQMWISKMGVIEQLLNFKTL
ncbi:Chlorophyll a-b binding protein 7, chloroplastic [Gracilariopsis chorda]|uniref:Chlorophyll a-b binding protein 7, chloroplastic n=1 Tax=Gracilariopsis chorda TaxID=448386 RepID=A0A2V3ITG1_9FLOR|nr:Chlorophyll a-b binding protein 7, chloroplastic [Gracilariopsis chorda]|eukprot:PXF45389.1 Chlorophyll a-b binding protein 7, chloroplastic [Gracilariopsis chorda]